MSHTKTGCFLTMLQISEPQFRLLTQNAKLLGGSETKPKVMETNNLIIKLFHPRKIFTSAKIYPHVKRFKKNSERLKKVGIAAASVQNVLHCKSRKAHIAIYKKIDGQIARDHVTSGNQEVLHRLPLFLAELHDKGIFFRGIHLGNLIVTPNNNFCLIDYVGLKVKSKPLNIWQRARNLRHLLLDRNDIHIFKSFGYKKFIAEYLKIVDLRAYQKKIFNYFIHKDLK